MPRASGTLPMMYRILAGFVTAAALAAACGGNGDGAAEFPTEDPLPEPGVVHVHGLDIDGSSGALYAATHTGLFRISDGKAERVGDRYQDTMGFTIDERARFLGSGHPDLRDVQSGKFQPNLGLIESRDKGKNWEPLSLMGEADFHALESVHGRIYGYSATGRAFLVSSDGKTWEHRSNIQMFDFAVDPVDPDVIIATTDKGIAKSADGGKTWVAFDGPPLVLVAWAPSGVVWGVGPRGEFHRAERGGSWEQVGSLGSRPQAMLVDGSRLFVATEAGISESSDGRTWTALLTP